jgi:hypothetical protein
VPVVAPGDSLSFQLDLFATDFYGMPCSSFLVAGYAMGEPRLPEPLVAPTPLASSSSIPTPAADPPDASETDQSVSENDGFYLPGLTDAAYRQFTNNAVGITNVFAAVLEFDSEQHASDALGSVRERWTAWSVRQIPGVPQDSYVSGPHEISAPGLGNASIAESAVLDHQGFHYSISRVFVQQGTLIYILGVYAIGADPVPVALDTVQLMLNRTPEPIPEDLFTLLPTLSDVPVGMYLEYERLPISFGPIPAPSDEAAS